VPFYESIIGNFVVYQHRIETNLLQLFAHPETSEWFSVISDISFEVKLLLNRNKHNNDLFVFLQVSIVLNPLTASPLLRCPWWWQVTGNITHEAFPGTHRTMTGRNYVFLSVWHHRDWTSFSRELHALYHSANLKPWHTIPQNSRLLFRWRRECYKLVSDASQLRHTLRQGFPTGGTRLNIKGYEDPWVTEQLISLIEQYISIFLGVLRMLWPDKGVRAAKKVGNPCLKRISHMRHRVTCSTSQSYVFARLAAYSKLWLTKSASDFFQHLPIVNWRDNRSKQKTIDKQFPTLKSSQHCIDRIARPHKTWHTILFKESNTSPGKCCLADLLSAPVFESLH